MTRGLIDISFNKDAFAIRILNIFKSKSSSKVYLVIILFYKYFLVINHLDNHYIY